MDEPKLIELYGDRSVLEGCLRVVGFTEERDSFVNRRESLQDIWGVWQPLGSAADYDDNEVYAGYEGCSFKLDSYTSKVPG